MLTVRYFTVQAPDGGVAVVPWQKLDDDDDEDDDDEEEEEVAAEGPRGDPGPLAREQQQGAQRRPANISWSQV